MGQARASWAFSALFSEASEAGAAQGRLQLAEPEAARVQSVGQVQSVGRVRWADRDQMEVP